MKRELMIRRIKDGCMEEYRKKHDNYWEELKQEMLGAGFINITCFVDGYSLFVYREYDETIFNTKGKDYFVYNSKWASEMAELIEPLCIRPEEVFHLGK